jgi:hypothetical protein
MEEADEPRTMHQQPPRSVAELLELPDDLRGLALWLLRSKSGASLTEVHVHTGKPKDTCEGMLATLLAKGIVQREVEQNKARYVLRAGWKRGASTGGV